MSANTVPVTFRNPAGHRLLGILHVPERSQVNAPAIVVLSPGIKSRVAPHRLYVKMARRLCDCGFLVLRFDYYGLGDSEGELDERFVADLYGSIQVGRYVQDTIAAMDYLEKEHGVQRFVLTGLCGGAITGLLAAERDRRVDSLIGLGIPIILDSRSALQNKYKYLTTNELRRFRQGYLRKVLSPKSWLRLLMLRSDYRIIIKALFAPLLTPIRTRLSRKNTAQQQQSPQSPEDAQNTNPYFAPAMLAVLASSRKVVLFFGETDRLYWEFEEKFHKRAAAEVAGQPGCFELRLIKGARHIFEEREHQEEVFQQMVAWLEQEYGFRRLTDSVAPLDGRAPVPGGLSRDI